MFSDAVAYGGWPIDVHTPGGILDFDRLPNFVYNFPGFYTIPYLSLIHILQQKQRRKNEQNCAITRTVLLVFIYKVRFRISASLREGLHSPDHPGSGL